MKRRTLIAELRAVAGAGGSRRFAIRSKTLDLGDFDDADEAAAVFG